MKTSKKPAPTPANQTQPVRKKTTQFAHNPSVTEKQVLTKAEGTYRTQERSGTEKRRASPMDMAVLATLIAIHHGLGKPNEKKDPEDCLFDAYDLFIEAEIA